MEIGLDQTMVWGLGVLVVALAIFFSPKDWIKQEKWSWNWELIRLWLWGPGFLGIVLTVGFFPKIGMEALWFSFVSAWGICFAAVYSMVGKKVRTILESVSPQDGEAVEVLMHNGRIQSPGVAVLNNYELRLIPIVGDPILIPLQDIVSISQTGWLPGKKLFSKHGYKLSTHKHPAIVFAVPPSVGNRWGFKLIRSKN